MSENTVNPIELVATNQTLQKEVNRLKRKLSETEAKLSQYQQYLTHDYHLARRIRRRTMMDRIPDLVLKALFRQMTRNDQLVARKVCHRWSVLVSEAARKVRFLALAVSDEYDRTRQSMECAESRLNHLSYGSHWRYLKLLQKEDGSPLYHIRPFSKWNSLQLNSLDEDAASQIVATFAGITELQVDIWGGRRSQCDNLAHLLEQWPHQLVTLKLSGIWSSEFDRLVEAINRLSILKHLSFNFFEGISLLDERIISQLAEFNAETGKDKFVTLLTKQDPAKLGQVRIGCVGEDPTDGFVSLPEQLRQRFVRFDFILISDYRTVCTAFRSLTTLDSVRLEDTTLRDFFNAVSQLTQLVSLGLEICFTKINPDDSPHLLLPQLYSIKSLQLRSVTASHRDLEQLQLQWTMPNVQVISITFEHRSFGRFFTPPPTICTECAFTLANLNVANLANCLRQFFGPLKQRCLQLRTILFSSKGNMEMLEEKELFLE